jgi:hypothetical protein
LAQGPPGSSESPHWPDGERQKIVGARPCVAIRTTTTTTTTTTTPSVAGGESGG